MKPRFSVTHFEQQIAVVRARLAHAAGVHSATPSALAMVRGPLALSADEHDFLWATIAVAIDPCSAELAGVIAGRDARRGWSIAQHAATFSLTVPRANALALGLIANSPLVRDHLVSCVDSERAITSGWIAAPRTVAFIAGDDTIDRELAGCGGRTEILADAHWQPEQLAFASELAALVDRMATVSRATERAHAPLVVVRGAVGGGRRSLIVHALGRPIVWVDCDRVGSGGIARVLAALAREAALTGHLPVLVNLDAIDGSDAEHHAMRRELASFALATTRPLLATSRRRVSFSELGRAVIDRELPPWSTDGRRALWQRALGGATTGSVIDHAASRFHVGPAPIAAVSGLLAQRTSIAIEDIGNALGATLEAGLGGLVTRHATQLTWSDLVVPLELREQIALLLARARHSHRVLDHWGIGRLLPSKGVSALFSGPPGTGKTMVAALIARELGVALYRVDLSQITSKWVGETEKQLERVFSAGDSGHIALLFDECDALFAKRGEVKGANDRYANLEINYLLQRLEAFDGLAMLTTNLDASLDPALRRRLSCHIRFPQPDAGERAQLWERMLPPAAPLADDIDLEDLATKFDAFSGAHIRNAIATAAFIAAECGGPLDHETLVRAAVDETRAIGRVIHSQRGL